MLWTGGLRPRPVSRGGPGSRSPVSFRDFTFSERGNGQRSYNFLSVLHQNTRNTTICLSES